MADRKEQTETKEATPAEVTTGRKKQIKCTGRCGRIKGIREFSFRQITRINPKCRDCISTTRWRTPQHKIRTRQFRSSRSHSSRKSKSNITPTEKAFISRLSDDSSNDDDTENKISELQKQANIEQLAKRDAEDKMEALQAVTDTWDYMYLNDQFIWTLCSLIQTGNDGADILIVPDTATSIANIQQITVPVIHISQYTAFQINQPHELYQTFSTHFSNQLPVTTPIAVPTAQTAVQNAQITPLQNQNQIQQPPVQVSAGVTPQQMTQLINAINTKNIPQIAPQRQALTWGQRQFELTSMVKFSAKFPRNEIEYYRYILALNRYVTDNVGISRLFLFKQFIHSLPQVIRQEWIQYQVDQFNNLIRHDGIERSTATYSAESENFFLTLQNNRTFVKFIDEVKLNLVPKINYFKNLIGTIYTKYNEAPLDTFRFIQRSLDEINIVINTMVKIGYEIRQFQPHEILELYQRVFMEQNCDKAFYNNGALNNKTKLHIAKKIVKLGAPITRLAFEQILTTAGNEILPPSASNTNKPGGHWELYSNRNSLFNFGYKQFGPKYIKKRGSESQKGKSDSGPKKKKQKQSEQYNQRCTNGFGCGHYIAHKKCRYKHSIPELKFMDKLHKLNAEPKKKGLKSIPKQPQPPKQNHFPPKNQTKCNKGQSCRFWQQGRCDYKHDNHTMRCRKCNKQGHPQVRCNPTSDKRGNGKGGGRKTFYNPTRSVNPNLRNIKTSKLLLLKGQPSVNTQTSIAQDVDMLQSNLEALQQQILAIKGVQKSTNQSPRR